jgi:hypothetical protein
MCDANGEAPDELLVALREMRDGLAHDPRAATVGGLSAVAGFLDRVAQQRRAAGQDVPQDLADPFLRLAGALVGLEEGAVDPLLAPAKPPNRPPVPFAVAYARAQAAAAMSALMHVNYSREAAARFVAQHLWGSPLLADADAEGEVWRVVAWWRDEIVAPRKKRGAGNETAADQYRFMVKAIAAQMERGGWGRAHVEEYARAQCAGLKEFSKSPQEV